MSNGGGKGQSGTGQSGKGQSGKGWSDRAVGSVLGLAIGDALGVPFVSRRAHEYPSPLPVYARSGPDGSAGSTGVDTAMARVLCASLARRDGLDVGDVLAGLVRWFGTDPPGVGTLTRAVLVRTRDGELDAARRVWEERGPEVSAGNGSVGYCAPLGVAYAHRPDVLHELAPALSALTHWDDRCRTAVTAITLAVAALVRGDRTIDAVQGALVAVEDQAGAEELEFLVEAIGDSRAVDGPDMGLCLFTTGVAFQAALREDEFETAMRRVVALGGDTDTNAAVAGALVGAQAGRSGLPGRWLDRLEERAAIEREAEALLPLAGRER